MEGLSARSDYTYETVPLILWSSTELAITIITACIPTYRFLWTRLLEFSRHSKGDDRLTRRTHSRSLGNTIRLRPQHISTRELKDDESERHILGTDENLSKEGIKLTRDFEVTVGESTGNQNISNI